MKIIKTKCDRCGAEYTAGSFYTPLYIACRMVDDIPVRIDLCEDCLNILAAFVRNEGAEKKDKYVI